MTPVAPVLEELAHHVSRLAAELSIFLEQSGPPWAGTPANTELQYDSDYAGAWGDHPVQDVLLLPFMLLQHTADHLYGIAGVLRAPETLMTHQTLTRAALASCATAHHVLEPSLVRERLRRGMNVYLLSYTEQMNMTDDEHLEALVHAIRRVDNIISAARAHGFGVSRAPAGRIKVRRRPMEPPYLGEPPLSESGLVRRLVGEDEDDPVGMLVYRMGSAFTHGQPHLFNMLSLQRLSSPVPGMGLGRIGVNRAGAARDTAAIAYGVHKTMLRACEHYGWNLAQWQATAQPALSYWRTQLEAL